MSERSTPQPLLFAFTSGADQRPTDAALVTSCAREEASALGALFDRHSEAIYRFFSRLGGLSNADLDELVSETFLHVYRSSPRFRGQASVRTWITAIAANVARHHLRSEARRRAALHTLSAHPPPLPEDTARIAERRQLLQRLQGLVAALPYDLRVAYVMCDLEELAGTDVARALGIPEGTLWRRLHEARRSLRAGLQGEDER